MRKWLIIASILLLTGCGGPTHQKRDDYLKVGTIAGPESELMEVAKKSPPKNTILRLRLLSSLTTCYLMKL